MSGSHYLSKWNVSRSCFNCRQTWEHYCRKCSGWLRSMLRESAMVQVTGRRAWVWWTWRHESSYRHPARSLHILTGSYLPNRMWRFTGVFWRTNWICYSCLLPLFFFFLWYFCVGMCVHLCMSFPCPYDDNFSGAWGLLSYIFVQTSSWHHKWFPLRNKPSAKKNVMPY